MLQQQNESRAKNIRSLTKDEINLLPIRAWEGDIVLVQDQKELDAALEELWMEPVLGFDTETKPTFSKGKTAKTAVIQFATEVRAYIVRLAAVPFGSDLAELLSSPDHLKVGVAIRDDMKALGRFFPFAPAGVIDLADLALSKGVEARGLRTLAASMLGFRISKSAQCSNWENAVLTPQQIRYAATDAWVGREIYMSLVSLP